MKTNVLTSGIFLLSRDAPPQTKDNIKLYKNLANP